MSIQLDSQTAIVSRVAPPAGGMAAAKPSLRPYLEILKRRKLVCFGVAAFVTLVGIGITASAKPVYVTQASFRTLRSAPAGGLGEAASGNNGGGVLPEAESPAAQIEAMRSAPFMMEALRRAEIRPGPGAPSPGVTVSSGKETGTIQILVQGEDPQAIARLANVIPGLHLERLQRLQQADFDRSAAALREEQEKAAGHLAAAEKSLLTFRSAHPAANPVQALAERTEAQRRREVLEEQVRSAQANVEAARAQLRRLRARLGAEPETSVEQTLSPNPRIATLREKVADLEAQQRDLLRDFRPGSDEVKAVEAQLADAKALLAREPETITERKTVPNALRATLADRIAEVEGALEAAQAQYAAARRAPLPPLPAELPANTARRDMEEARRLRDRDAAQSIYSMLSTRLKSLEIHAGAQQIALDAFQKAEPPSEPVSPRRKRDLAATLLLAAALAIGTAFLLEHLDDRIYSRADVERVSLLPALGYVPPFNARQGVHITSMPADSLAVEAYRSLRSNIQFIAPGPSQRRLLVTSATTDEGKTVTAVNLATAMALDGKRVILVDGDLRRPSVARMFGLTDAAGLKDVLCGEWELDEAMHETEIPNLRILGAGSPAPNPAELLGSPEFRRLAARLDELADVVIFDSSPCLPVADPLILAAQADGVLLVVRGGHTRTNEVSAAEDLLNRTGSPILGVVYNRIDRDGQHYAYYRRA
jgi:polysaccharide biosynthesis transport protein